jgi:hypothetical protein
MTTIRALDALGRLKETEDGFQARIVAYAQLQGWLVAHFRPGRTADSWRTAVTGDGAGFPDLTLVRSGRLIYAELKGPRGRLSGPQKRWLNALAATAAEVYVWHPDDWDTVVETLTRDR